MDPSLTRAQLEDAVRRWDFSEYYDVTRDLLFLLFPQLQNRWCQEEQQELSENVILEEIYNEDPALAVEMWRALLDIAQDQLSEPDPAEFLLEIMPDFVWLGDHPLEPVLQELKRDERFARQIFQSAHVGYTQTGILSACREEGEDVLWDHLMNLLNSSPYPYDPDSVDLSDDGPLYAYCGVEVEGGRGAYSYLAGGLKLAPGDVVEVPFGPDNELRQGIVAWAYRYAADDTPWPLEETKTVERLVERAAPPAAQSEEKAVVERPVEKTKNR